MGSASSCFAACKAPVLFSQAPCSFSRAPNSLQPRWEELSLKHQQPAPRAFAKGAAVAYVCSQSKVTLSTHYKLLFSFWGICRRTRCQAGSTGGRAGRARRSAGGSLCFHFCPWLLWFESSSSPVLNASAALRGFPGGSGTPQPDPQPRPLPGYSCRQGTRCLYRNQVPGAVEWGKGGEGLKASRALGLGDRDSRWSVLWAALTADELP